MSGSEPLQPAPDDETVCLEGFHAVKHALRFGAELLEVRTGDRDRLAALARELAPDVAEPLLALAEPGPGPFPPTGVVARARRPQFELPPPSDRFTVLLDRPRHLGNLGAAIRVAAAAGAAAVLVTGEADPWHRHAIRGAAGLQFALPVGRVANPPDDLPLVALDPEGDPPRPLPPGAVLAFGSERHGLSPALLARADARIALPMRPGVSSLNLATAVAAALYGLTRTPRPA
ncbi:MAG TPA: TrmH family RNA methyltransferase [Solirubrobacteraceae bacterium]|nr:TrmH family RNA methyltransferase [Solirubrobacteraceae bacterium]